MKKIVTIAILLLSSVSVFAQGKIAVVNFEQALLNTDVVKAKLQELEQDSSYKELIEEAKQIQEDGKGFMEKFKKEMPTMSQEQKAQAEVTIKNKKSDMEHVARKMKEAESAALAPVMYTLQQQATQVVKDIVDSEGIGLLLHASMQQQVVLHADTSFDISAKVTDRLNKLNKK